MKKVIILVIVALTIVFVSACKEESVEQLEDIDISLYEEYYDYETYKIFVLSEIPDSTYFMYALHIGPEDDSCIIGAYHEVNFLVEYEDAYYSIGNFDQFGLYDCDELGTSGFLSETFPTE